MPNKRGKGKQEMEKTVMVVAMFARLWLLIDRKLCSNQQAKSEEAVVLVVTDAHFSPIHSGPVPVRICRPRLAFDQTESKKEEAISACKRLSITVAVYSASPRYATEQWLSVDDSSAPWHCPQIELCFQFESLLNQCLLFLK
ncbi:hypothetical protein TYRP_010581 [Tyrophagus putrescentiae]|nr:hypothetical protein TYRP_010581 [Tyrophagus putrescentiae]